MTTKNTNVTIDIHMLIHVQVTIPFLLPCLPTYLAPNAANNIEGIMLITVSIVAI